MKQSDAFKIALFDFDGTITRRDTVIPFVIRCGRFGRLARLSLRAILKNPQKLLARDRDFVKGSVIAAALAGLDRDAISVAIDNHVNAIMSRGLRKDVVAAINSHIAQGHEIVIVSASFGIYLDAIAVRIGASHVIASELEICDACLTGRLASENCRSFEKVRRVSEWLATRQSHEIVAAYGNSSDDRPFLGLASHGYLVGRRRIKRIAQLPIA